MTKKEEKSKVEEVEREYVIPLRAKFNHVPRYRKTPKAVKSVKEFLARHMKVYDRDLKKIKIDRFLNEYLWFRGIKNPPHKVKVKAIRNGDIINVELAEMPSKLKFKKASEEKREENSKKILESSKSTMQKAKEAIKKPKEDSKKEEDKEKDKEKEQEKKSAVVEAGQKIQKQQAKKQKHITQPKATKQMHREQKIMSTK